MPDEHQLFVVPSAADDERGEQDPELAEAEEEAQIEAITEAAESGAAPDADVEHAELWRREQALLDHMQAIAEQARHVPDAKTLRLIDWMREKMYPELPPFGRRPKGRPPRWNERPVLVFTENREGTKRYLRNILEQAIAGSDRADERIEVIDGLTQGARRKEVQRRFNADPAVDPLRLLLAADAAREGLNFQAHCADLFHFDLPWNPGRIEQRNGRIDRKLQPAAEVRCHYFVLPQREEDKVLEVLVRKTETIKRELGSLSKVIDDDVERRLRGGIRHRDADRLKQAIEKADLDEVRRQITEEELEAARDRRDDLTEQVERCRGLLERSRTWVGFEAEPFRDALSCALELLGAEQLARDGASDGGVAGQETWTFPALERRTGADPTWAATLDTLRPPRRRDQKLADWRREAPIRPVVFEDAGVLGDDTVHLHLEQRVAQRLLARFRAQGFVHHDLSRACLAQARDSIPRVVLLGRLCLYGRRAERLGASLSWSRTASSCSLSTPGNQSRNCSMVAPSRRFSNSADTGTRVPRNTQALLTFSGSRSTAGQVCQVFTVSFSSGREASSDPIPSGHRLLSADAFLRQVVMRLPPHPECGIAPTNAFQRQCHRRRDAGTTVQHPRQGLPRAAQLLGRLGHRPALGFQRVPKTLARVRGVVHRRHGCPHRPLMVVDQVHVDRHAVLEAKDDSPVPRDPHAPLSPPVSAQTVQPVAGEVQVARLHRGVEIGQDAANPRRQRCRDAPSIPPLEERQQPLVRNLDIPTVHEA